MRGEDVVRFSAWERDAREALTFWESPSGEEWLLAFQLVEIAGRVECVGVDVRSHSDDFDAPPRPLSAYTLRRLPFASLLAQARRGTARALRAYHEGLAKIAERPDDYQPRPGFPRVEVHPKDAAAWRALGEAAARFYELPDGQKSGRHAAYTGADLQRVAAVYAAAYASGSTSPTREVAERLRMSRNTAAKLVARCRNAGLLAPTERGIPGGIVPPQGGETR